MARYKKSTRTTPRRGAPVQSTDASGRYTTPIPREFKVSPKWVPITMFTALLLGMAVIIVNYLDVLPGGASNWYLLAGLVLITIGFLAATQLH